MTETRQVELYAYRYSVYAWIVRLTLSEKGVPWIHHETDPFGDLSTEYLRLNPFGTVPTLVHDGFVLFETAAIARYVDEAFPGRALQPRAPRCRARMAQAIGIIDSYGYRPMVRQVFAHRVFRPAAGEPFEEAVITDGLAKSRPVLAALDALCSGDVLIGHDLSLADLHLAPMMSYFTMAPEGAELLASFPRLSAWWAARRPTLIASDPGLPTPDKPGA